MYLKHYYSKSRIQTINPPQTVVKISHQLITSSQSSFPVATTPVNRIETTSIHHTGVQLKVIAERNAIRTPNAKC
jgi:hypothetical protein